MEIAMLLEDFTIAVAPPECLPTAVLVTATIDFDDDLTELMPYLNAELGPCVYDPDVPFLRFRKNDKVIGVYPKKIFATGFRDEIEAREVFEAIRVTINSIAERKAEIEPSYRSLSELRPLDIFKLLPRDNCGQCVQGTCMAFAAAVANGEADADDCPALTEEKWAENRSQLLGLLGNRT